MHGHFLNVFIHTYLHYNGVCFLYINNSNTKYYVEDIKVELENLKLLDDEFEATGAKRIEIPP